MNSKLAIFEEIRIRKTIFNNEWWFSIVDIIDALNVSGREARKYWSDLKKQLIEEGYTEVSEKIGQLKLQAQDGKMRLTDCANTETCFRIIQSIPSSKAEPFKKWLAKVGYERIQEIENPELAMDRMKDLYSQKGYSKDWIDKRSRGVSVRHTLTDEWKDRGVKQGIEYAILTSEISKATFGMTPSEYKKLKGLDRENLRDHMTDLELIFTMLGEASTTEIIKNNDLQGFDECKVASKKGGNIAGEARKKLEKEGKKKVSTKENFLENKKLIN